MSQATVSASRSQAAFERALKRIPGGVNSPVRSCKSVESTPVFIDRADGAYMWDIDGNRYIDYVGSWGPMILGHRHPRVLEAIEDVLQRGTSFGAPCLDEVEMAELVCRLVPSIEVVRMVNSGTEACMSAVRLARAFTGRPLIIKFDGCYHGHADSFLVKAGSGLATLGIASSPGVPSELSLLTISLPYNNREAVKQAFAEHGDRIAAVIVEPIAANAGLLMPAEGFLDELRRTTEKHGALLIFDEVMSGFRVALGGAQERYGIKPDLTCLGKIIGGGLPVGAYGGRADIMAMVAPQGPVYQAGTLSGNPLAMSAGLAQLKMLQFPQTYQQLDQRTDKLVEGLSAACESSPVPVQVVSVTGMICVFFTKAKITDFQAAQTADSQVFGKFWRSLLARGIYWPPSQYEVAFMSLVHSKKDIEETVAAFAASLKDLA